MLLAANWKMNKTAAEAVDFVVRYARAVPPSRVTTAILAPFTALPAVAQTVKEASFPAEGLAFGAQNVYFESLGAFTGEVSATMLTDLGCTYCICGHSERRKLFGDTDEVVSKKVIRCIEVGLIPIFCIGETLEERNGGILELVIKRQLDVGLSRLKEEAFSQVVIAYEPVWAIGTGVVATPEQAEEVHTFVRTRLTAMCGARAENIPILYGGSVTPENCLSLMSQKHIDGALVGGASLRVDSLLKLHEACTEAENQKSKQQRSM